MTYTVYKVNLDDSLSHRENLNNLDELNTLLANPKHAHLLIVQDQTGKERHAFITSDRNGIDFYDIV